MRDMCETRQRPRVWDAIAASALSETLIGALLFAVFVLAGTSKPARSQNAPPNAAGPSSSEVIRSEADLVVLPVTVTGRHGHFVSGLKQKDFHVYVDGKPQNIMLFMHDDAPVTAGLVIDCSGSMKENREKVLEAAKDFLGSSNPRDQIFVVNFNETADLGLPGDTPFTSNVSQLISAVETGPSEGLTALYDAIALGLRHLALGANHRKALIIISDGGDDASELNLKKTLAAVQRSSTVIYTIGIVASDQANVNPGALKKMAKDTGGQSYFPRSSDQLPGICQQIARDLREQYTIAFLPERTPLKSGFRKIRVAVKAAGHGGLKVRTRPGYLAEGS
jgi:Ca-activated chloride channel homolog